MVELVDLKANTTRTLLNTNDIVDVSSAHLFRRLSLICFLQEHGNKLGVASWQLSADMKFILIKTDYMKVPSASSSF